MPCTLEHTRKSRLQNHGEAECLKRLLDCSSIHCCNCCRAGDAEPSGKSERFALVLRLPDPRKFGKWQVNELSQFGRVFRDMVRRDVRHRQQDGVAA